MAASRKGAGRQGGRKGHGAKGGAARGKAGAATPATKADLRDHYRHAREAMSAEKRSAADAAIAQHVAMLPEYAGATVLFCYLSMADEVDTRALIEAAWAAGKTVAIPRCVPHTRDLVWHRVTSFDGLETSSFGIEEPADRDETRLDPAQYGREAMAVVPGLSFDEDGYRLGYGGGFYDVFLETFGGVSVGLCREKQMCERLAVREDHDVPVQVVVTDQRIIKPSELQQSLMLQEGR
jgi:5-formyltetrahydrofolate cyclo-ligase